MFDNRKPVTSFNKWMTNKSKRINEKLVSFLTANKGKNFVKSTGREIHRFIQKQGLDKTFVECDGHMWRVGDRNLPFGIQMDGGSDWMALSKPFVKYVASDVRNELLSGLDQIYKHTLLPAESFFHVVLRNTEFCDRYIDNNLHLTNWKRHLGCRCQYKHIVDWCGCSPNDFTSEDWPRIVGTASNDLFFARKFEPVINQGIINKLEEWLLESFHYNGKPLSTTPGWLSYWQSIYHKADLSPSDDSIVSLSTSLSRLAARTVLNIPVSELILNESSVVELTSYYHDDIFQGVLVKFKLNDNSVMEAWFKLPSQFYLLDVINGKFLKNVYVTHDFDLKEETSRSLQGIVSPLSTFSVVYETLLTEPTNLTILIEDPASKLAYVSDVRLDSKEQNKPYTGSTKVPLAKPHLPGVWSAHVYHAGFYIASVKFLVVPLRTLNGEPLNEQKAGLVHAGVSNYQIAADKQHWAAALANQVGSKSAFFSNQPYRIGHDLHVWADGLVSRFFTHVATCHFISNNKNSKLDISAITEECESTVWSSAAPDPKSHILSFSLANGKIS